MLPAAGAQTFELRDRNVHVWPVRLKASDAAVSELEPRLAPEELGRADRFRSDSLRRSFVIARGALRFLLGRYLSTPPSLLRFAYAPKGKPSVDDRSGIAFNLSHAGDIVIFAFTVGCELGIDIEPIRSIADTEDIARRFFCSAEVEEWLSLPESQRDLGFYRCWTRKESFIKATGEGLSAVTNQFRVSLLPDVPTCILQVPPQTGPASAWTLHNLDVAPGYAAAIAYRDRERPVQVFPLIDVEDLIVA